MATIKAYTDISQSKKLAEILPLESADAFYVIGKEPVDIVVIYGFVTHKTLEEQIAYKRAVPCWSLAALLGILKDKITFGGASDKEWFVSYTIKNPTKVLFIYKSNLVDACVAMIEKLNELKML